MTRRRCGRKQAALGCHRVSVVASVADVALGQSLQHCGRCKIEARIKGREKCTLGKSTSAGARKCCRANVRILRQRYALDQS